MNKKVARRIRRSMKTRAKIKELEMPRLSVHRSNKNIYVQLLSPCGSKVMAAASTLSKEFKASGKKAGNKEAATEVGKIIAKIALEKGIKEVAFDRSGYQYHGRVAALANAARENGLNF